MNNGEIKLVSSQSNAIHIIQLIDASSPGNKPYEDVKDDIKAQISSSEGSKKYFALLDSIKEKLYEKDVPLENISDTYNLEYNQSKPIDSNYSDDILTSAIVEQLI